MEQVAYRFLTDYGTRRAEYRYGLSPGPDRQPFEPTMEEDFAYGLRLVVDIAERSLSDSPFQDPTTAVQAIDRLHDVLRQLALRPFPDGLLAAATQRPMGDEHDAEMALHPDREHRRGGGS